jgi:hypothetical protein
MRKDSMATHGMKGGVNHCVWLPMEMREDVLKIAERDRINLSATLRRLISLALRIERAAYGGR